MKLSILFALLAITTNAYAVYEDFTIDNSTIASAQYIGDLNTLNDIHVFGARGEISQFGTTISDNSFADFYSFDVGALSTIKINVLTSFGPDGFNDPIVALFDATGVQVAFDNDTHASGSGKDAMLTYDTQAASFFTVAVSGFDDFDFADEDGDTNFLYTLEVLSVPTSDVSNVPLPATAWLFVTGLIGLVSLGRRKI